MGLGKLLKKLVPIAVDVSNVVVASSPEGKMAGALVRQLLLVGGTALAAKGVVSNEQVPQLVGAVMTVGTIVVGQLKTRHDQVQQIALADQAPNGTVVGAAAATAEKL